MNFREEMDKDSRFLSKSTGNLRHSEWVLYFSSVKRGEFRRSPVADYFLDLNSPRGYDKDSLAPFSVRRGSNSSALSERSVLPSIAFRGRRGSSVAPDLFVIP